MKNNTFQYINVSENSYLESINRLNPYELEFDIGEKERFLARLERNKFLEQFKEGVN